MVALRHALLGTRVDVNCYFVDAALVCMSSFAVRECRKFMLRECGAWFAHVLSCQSRARHVNLYLVLIVAQIVGNAKYIHEYAQPTIL